MIKNILIIALYVSLFLLLAINTMKMMIFNESIDKAIISYSLGNLFNVLLWLLLCSYTILFIISYFETDKPHHFREIDTNFWKKILILKPFSGILAFNFCKKRNVKVDKISSAIKLSYYLKNTFFFTSVAFFLFLLIAEDPSDLLLITPIIGIHLAILMHFIFEPLILIDAWQRNKEEWQQLNYYEYFSSIKPKLNYSEYFKKYFH